MNPRQIRTCRRLLPLALLFLLPCAAHAQSAQSVPDNLIERRVPRSPVVVDGETLFRVRGVSVYPAQERADTIASRIVEVAIDRKLSPDSLRIQETGFSSQIFAGQTLVMNVLDADVESEGVIPRGAVAGFYLDRIRQAVIAYRVGRNEPALRSAALSAVVGTIAVIALLAAITWVGRKLDALLERRYGRRVEALAAKSLDVVTASRLLTTFRTSLRVLRAGVLLILVFGYLQWVLERFPQTRAAGRSLAGFIVDPLSTMWWGFVAWIPNLFFLAVLTGVVTVVLRLLRRFFDSVAADQIHLASFYPEWAAPTYRLLRPVAIAFALVVGYPYIPGSSSDAFKGVSLFLGVMLSLGSSSFIANMIAGYTVIYRRAFKDGDVVKVGEVLGFVTAVRMLDTHVRTFKNEDVAVPNSQLLNSHVVNYSALSKTSGLILHTVAGIGYETPWRQVEAMLIEAARRTPGLGTEPAPFVLQLKLDDFCVQYELNAHCDEPLRMLEIYTALHRNILDVFNEYGVQIMTPAYMADPGSPKVVPPAQWYVSPAEPDGARATEKPSRGAAFT